MAEVVRQSRKRKADREQAMVQDVVTVLFRMVMCEPTIMQRLVRWLDFRTLVTLVAFTDRNLRLRYATHHPGRHVTFVVTDRDQYRKVQDEHTKRITNDSLIFDWSRRITDHLGTPKVYTAPNPYINVLRLYLDDVRGAKRRPHGSVFKCLYCDNPDLVSPKNRNTYYLVNEQLSPLNCCCRCYRKRFPNNVYVTHRIRSTGLGWNEAFQIQFIMGEMERRLMQTLKNDQIFLGNFDDQTLKEILKYCSMYMRPQFLSSWPEFLGLADPSLVCRLTHTAQQDTYVIRLDLLQHMLEGMMTMIKHMLWDMYSSRSCAPLVTNDILECLRWDARYVAYMNKNPEFRALFTPSVLEGIDCFTLVEHNVEPDAKKPKYNSGE
jgi:hypothetical protein